MYGAVELGGTKTVCAAGDPAEGIACRTAIPTRDPDSTMDAVVSWLSGFQPDAVGIGSFGPVSIIPGRDDYGRILHTPKPGWQGYDVLGRISEGSGVPAAIDTDVGCSCLGEYNHGSHAGADPMVYITVGTGIGAAVVHGGKVLHGVMHPEFGHLSMRRIEGDGMAGVCPFHPDCAESLASGPALLRRAGRDPRGLSLNHPAWTAEADYIAQLVLDTIYAYSPEKVVMGGGVMSQPGFLDAVCEDVLRQDGGFVFRGLDEVRNTVVGESLGGDQAVWGCFDIADSITI